MHDNLLRKFCRSRTLHRYILPSVAGQDGNPRTQILCKEESDDQGEAAKTVLDGLRAELAALSPEQRRATPLFIFNPAYFDPALPRTAVQLITIRFVDLEGTGKRLNDRPDASAVMARRNASSDGTSSPMAMKPST